MDLDVQRQLGKNRGVGFQPANAPSQAGSLHHFHSIVAFALLCSLLSSGSRVLAQSTTANTTNDKYIQVDECIVRFSEEIDVPAMETGRVADVLVKQNDPISTGAVIARLEDRSLLIRRRSALLRLDAARSETSDDVEVRYAEIALAEAEAELETSRSIQKDVRGAVPMSQVRKLRLAVERGELEVIQAKKRKHRAEIEVELREADLATIDDQLRSLNSESPISGIVLSVVHAAGEWVEKGNTIATIGRLDRLNVIALMNSEYISPADCRGLRVSVHWVDASTGQARLLRGRVLSTDPQSLPGGRFRFHAEIENEIEHGASEHWLLHPGATVEMKVHLPASIAANRASHLR